MQLTLQEYVEQIIAYEHMGKLADPPNIQLEPHFVNRLRISWNCVFEGKVVRQFAQFQFTAMSLDVNG